MPVQPAGSRISRSSLPRQRTAPLPPGLSGYDTLVCGDVLAVSAGDRDDGGAAKLRSREDRGGGRQKTRLES
jgi:hypothetical protein